jgi:hypothetical protein
LQQLELALSEFPGCAVLRLHYLEHLIHCNDIVERNSKIKKDFVEALQAVGRGSHCNKASMIEYLVKTMEKPRQITNIFVV